MLTPEETKRLEEITDDIEEARACDDRWPFGILDWLCSRVRECAASEERTERGYQGAIRELAASVLHHKERAESLRRTLDALTPNEARLCAWWLDRGDGIETAVGELAKMRNPDRPGAMAQGALRAYADAAESALRGDK